MGIALGVGELRPASRAMRVPAAVSQGLLDIITQASRAPSATNARSRVAALIMRMRSTRGTSSAVSASRCSFSLPASWPTA